MVYILLGIATIAIIYFYALTTAATASDKKKGTQQDDEDKNGETVSFPSPRVSPSKRPMRYCPICQSEMGPFDKLYGEIYKAEPRDKVFIKGCRSCYAIPGTLESQPDYDGAINL